MNKLVFILYRYVFKELEDNIFPLFCVLSPDGSVLSTEFYLRIKRHFKHFTGNS